MNLPMNTRRIFAAILMCETMWLASCKVDADLPVVETLPIDSSNYEYAITGGNVLDDGGDAVVARGVCVSIDANIIPSVTSAGGDVYWTKDSSGIGQFTSRVTAKWTGANHSIRHTHYIRAYASNGAGTGYGEIITYTPNSKPLSADVVSFRDPVIDGNSITISYNMAANGCYITQFVLCYDTLTEPTIDKQCISVLNPYDENPILIQELNDSTTYYFRFFMKNDEGAECYSNETSGTTE